MKPTKYRLWDKFEKKWKESYHYHLAPNGQLYYGGMNITEHNEIVFWTGLHDKNGKEIYEGDVIASKSYGGQSMVIKWSDDPENHGWYCHDVNGGDEDHLNMLEAVECQVIGNEYEHPHLLEEESA